MIETSHHQELEVVGPKLVLLLSGAALVAGVALPPTTQDANTSEQLRQKREILEQYPVFHAAPIVHATPLIHTAIPAVPLATSSSQRYDIHKSTAILHTALAPLYRKKRAISYIAPAAAVTSYAASYPVATSHHEQYQVHNAAHLIHELPLAVETPAVYHAPAAVAPVVHSAPLVAPVASAVYPAATSSQRRFQIHNNARFVQEYHQPLYAFAPAFDTISPVLEQHHYVAQPAAVAPLAGGVLATLPAAPAGLPAQIGQAGQQQQLEGQQQQESSGAAPASSGAEGDSVTVDAARKASQ
ncbi:hypothetical protein QAD02_001512 [Eretmocerus hayati]|uniref:Uncharacterized protein n=1 Tax=Eretmocerus hayati TaxID=131215 RepID=A0ACC2NGE8_9HYME|nr:hypothetical protein QAD02_001512 [Eretmocerus hayati]